MCLQLSRFREEQVFWTDCRQYGSYPFSESKTWMTRMAFMENQPHLIAFGTNATLLWNCPSIQMRVSAGMALRILKEIAVHAKSTFHDCIRSYALARNGRSCRGSGQWGAAALSASAASAYPYAGIDRPETCSTYERSGVDSGTAAAGPAFA